MSTAPHRRLHARLIVALLRAVLGLLLRLVYRVRRVDTDRLPEEKKRALTIDLGFAYIGATSDRPEPIGFVDVPGHERFVKNALCGLAGTDFVLFVIAADDGPMPQTREHLAIIDLLGITRGADIIRVHDVKEMARVAKMTDAIVRAQ